VTDRAQETTHIENRQSKRCVRSRRSDERASSFSNLVNPDLMLRSVVFNHFTITAHCLVSRCREAAAGAKSSGSRYALSRRSLQFPKWLPNWRKRRFPGFPGKPEVRTAFDGEPYILSDIHKKTVLIQSPSSRYARGKEHFAPSRPKFSASRCRSSITRVCGAGGSCHID
jgi:hypothetical protein